MTTNNIHIGFHKYFTNPWVIWVNVDIGYLRYRVYLRRDSFLSISILQTGETFRTSSGCADNSNFISGRSPTRANTGPQTGHAPRRTCIHCYRQYTINENNQLRDNRCVVQGNSRRRRNDLPTLPVLHMRPHDVQGIAAPIEDPAPVLPALPHPCLATRQRLTANLGSSTYRSHQISSFQYDTRWIWWPNRVITSTCTAWFHRPTVHWQHTWYCSG